MEWETDIKEWNNITEQTAALYISQAEQRLQDTINTDQILTTSNDKLLNILSSISTISIGYLFAGKDLYLQSVCFFALFICMIASIYIFKNLSNYINYGMGEQPSSIFISPFIDGIEVDVQYIGLVYRIMESIQYKININQSINKTRWIRLRKAKYVLLSLPLSFVLASLYQWALGWHLVWVQY